MRCDECMAGRTLLVDGTWDERLAKSAAMLAIIGIRGSDGRDARRARCVAYTRLASLARAQVGELTQAQHSQLVPD